jgi:tRNA-uridine 2-sulfurtransferase
MKDMIRAIGLISGGLDSLLAVRVLQEQGTLVIGISCRHPFQGRTVMGKVSYPELAARQLGIELVRPDVTEQMLTLVAAPPHGHGKHLNPCIDCRILYLTEAAKLMRERGAKFLATGEVLGQRPMSQRRDSLDVIDRDSGLRGQVVRPLSAKLLRPTKAEQEGWVDRERLLSISGRGRHEQMRLAEQYGFTEYSAPAGGCLLTMDGFAAKVADLVAHEGGLSAAEVELLKRGRHFRLGPRTKLVVGKDDGDNRDLEALAGSDDLTLQAADEPGPIGVLRGPVDEPMLALAATIMARYVDAVPRPICIAIGGPGGESRTLEASAATRDVVEEYRI